MNRVASVMAGRGLDFKLKEGLSAETSGLSLCMNECCSACEDGCMVNEEYCTVVCH